ncbi:MAG: hypothetical protein HFACDABA_01591 [Anaerolineales bacterium]|nr:hypothetical protein [Anaerolineales bacterium]
MNESERAYLNAALGMAVLPRSPRANFRSLTLPDGRAYLLPVGARRAFANALTLYQTHRVTTRLIHSLMSAGARLGWSQRLLPVEDLGGADAWNDFFAGLFQRGKTELAISLGTPGPQRKPVIQILSSGGDTLGYAKVGWNEITARLVQREADALETVTACAKTFAAPHVIFAGQWRKTYLCVQSAPATRAYPAATQLNRDFVRAVSALSLLDRHAPRLEETRVWKSLEARLERSQADEPRLLLQQAERVIQKRRFGNTLPVHFAHGDFTPWNAARLRSGLYLYDWESFAPDRPAGYDLFHFLIRVHSLVKKSSPPKMLSAILNAMQREPAAQYWKNLDLQFEPEFLLLYLVERLVSPPQESDAPDELRLSLRLLELCLAGMQ